ncbi:hypothetical protein BDZ91DRAFT_732865, partial [Kalaharituber pfeilii]
MEWRGVCTTIEYQKLINQWKKSKDVNENFETTANNKHRSLRRLQFHHSKRSAFLQGSM